MYNLTVYQHHDLYEPVIPSVARHECRFILPFLSPPIINYTVRHFLAGDKRFKKRFGCVFERETTGMVLVAFTHGERYGIWFSRQGVPRITQSQGYSVLAPLPAATTRIINPSYVTHLFYGGDLDVGLVLLTIDHQHGVYCMYVDSIMEYPLLCYDWNTGRVVGLPIHDFREVNMTLSNRFGNCCVLVFPIVDTRMSRPAEMSVEAYLREAKKLARMLNLIRSEDDNNNPPYVCPTVVSPGPEAYAESEEHRQQLITNTDTWYSSMELVLRPLMLKYKVKYISSIT